MTAAVDGMGEKTKPALQVIVLGSGGGPLESNTTAFLVRSVAQEWHKGSVVAVDAGVHLSAITRLLKETLPSPLPSIPYTVTDGPFAGLTLPHKNADSNAGYITSSLVETYLITHPHLDHISGFVINTAGPPGARPKKLAGLPGTIHAFKTHIFNNVIWPNLSDENNGAGLVTYLRLVEGGSPALGDGEGKGYSEICDGLLVKIWGVSHGHCIEKHSHRGSTSSSSGLFTNNDTSCSGGNQSSRHSHPPPQNTPRRQSLLSQSFGAGSASPQPEQEKFCVYDSSAYFIQDQAHRREVLIFGDVEPDSISLSPRNLQIWQEAAPKIASGTLAAIFIECSYDDSRSNDRLFGHLKPAFLMEELRVLAAEVDVARRAAAGRQRSQDSTKKRKRLSDSAASTRRSVPKQSASHASEDALSPKSFKLADDVPALAANSSSGSKTAGRGGTSTPNLATPTNELSLNEMELSPPLLPYNGLSFKKQLEGIKVVVIHVKDTLTDDSHVGETILEELREHEKEAQLGCEFFVSHPGQSFYL